jgi:SAM-dependent methyltransferase
VSHTSFVGEVPERYNACLGPLLFEPYAAELAARAAAPAPAHVLETACGTGILTRRLAAVLGGRAEIVATDLNEAMIAVARRDPPPGVELAVADMTALPFPDGRFDLVVCQFGVMFVPDKGLAAREAWRVLTPGGTWLLSTWAPLAENEVLRTTHEAIASVFPDDPPSFYETPGGYGAPDVLAGLLAAAGFADPRVERVSATGHAASAHVAATGLVLGNPVALEIRARDPARLEDAVRAVERALSARYGTGAIEVPLEALVATGAG